MKGALLFVLAVGGVGNVTFERGRFARDAASPNAVTDLRVVAATDTSLVLSWKEVSTNGAGVARYAIRYNRLSDGPLVWSTVPDVLTGGCGAPVYGSTAGGGRVRSCVLGSLEPATAYQIQLVAYTGTLNTTAVFGPLSNIAPGTTGKRMGQILVSRPGMWLDSITVSAASLSDFGGIRFPVTGRFLLGDRMASFYDSTGAIVAVGYLFIGKP